MFQRINLVRELPVLTNVVHGSLGRSGSPRNGFATTASSHQRREARMVGAGGIGGEWTTAFTVRAFDTALTIILMILVVVVLAERLSGVARRRMLGSDQLARSI